MYICFEWRDLSGRISIKRGKSFKTYTGWDFTHDVAVGRINGLGGGINGVFL